MSFIRVSYNENTKNKYIIVFVFVFVHFVLQDKMFYIRMMLALLVFVTVLVFFALYLGFSQANEIEEEIFKSISTQNVTGTKFSSN